jgi:hypothetical protein
VVVRRGDGGRLDSLFRAPSVMGGCSLPETKSVSRTFYADFTGPLGPLDMIPTVADLGTVRMVRTDECGANEIETGRDRPRGQRRRKTLAMPTCSSESIPENPWK